MFSRHYSNHKKSNIGGYSIILETPPSTNDRKYVIELTSVLSQEINECGITNIPDFIQAFKNNNIKSPEVKKIIFSYTSKKKFKPNIKVRTLKNCNAFEKNMIITVIFNRYNQDFIDYIQSFVQKYYSSQIDDYKVFCDELIEKVHQITPKNQLEQSLFQDDNLNEHLVQNSQLQKSDLPESTNGFENSDLPESTKGFENSDPLELIDNLEYDDEFIDLYFEEQPYY